MITAMGQAPGGLTAQQRERSAQRRILAAALTLAASAALGAGDQYLGSISRWPLGTAVSLMSAPWLVLPFCAGCTQDRPRRAALAGLAVTTAALFGYCAMTLSPVENVHLSQDPAAIAALLQSQARVLAGGLLTGPLFGWLGQQWRTRRSRLSALAVSGAVLLEPLTRVAHLESGPAPAYLAELAAGALAGAYFLAVIRARAGGTRRRLD